MSSFRGGALMRQRRPFVIAAVVLLFLVAAGMALFLGRTGEHAAEIEANRAAVTKDETIAALAPPEAFAFRWPAGTVYTYGVTLDVAGTFAPAASIPGNHDRPLAARLALAAELVLVSYGQLDDHAGHHVLGVRLGQVQRVEWTLGGQPVLSGDATSLLTGEELALEAASDGAFAALHAAAGELHHRINLMRQVLAPLQTVVSSGSRSWTARQTEPVGDIEMAYEVRGDRPDRLLLGRRPEGCTRLAAGPVLDTAGADVSGMSEIVLNRTGGHLARVSGDETVRTGRNAGEEAFHQKAEFAIRLLSVKKTTVGMTAEDRLAGLVSTGLGDTSTSAEMGRTLLAQQAGTLTMEKLAEDLFVHGRATELPDAGRWMWQATGFLRLHPERCSELTKVFQESEMNRRGRARVLDLLTAVGTPEAQAVLRTLLETPEAKGTDRYELLLQRLSLLDAPTEETVEYLRAKVQKGEGDEVLAAAHALGAAIGKRTRTAGGALDEPSASLLRDGLLAAGTKEEKTAWLGTLGNAGLADDVPLLLKYTRDEAPSVRAAAAGSLRKIQTPETEQALLTLSADADKNVRSRALSALRGYTLSPGHLAALEHQVGSGQLTEGDFPALMSVLQRNRHQPDAVLPVLDMMRRQNNTDRRMALRIRELQKTLTSR